MSNIKQALSNFEAEIEKGLSNQRMNPKMKLHIKEKCIGKPGFMNYAYKKTRAINKGRFCFNSKMGKQISKRLSVENKAKLSPLEIVNKQY